MVSTPDSLTVGETLTLKLSIDGLESAILYLRGSSIADIDAEISEDTATFKVDTSEFEAGNYAIEIWAVTGGGRVLIHRARLRLNESIASQAEAVDQRSQAERIVAAIEDYIERGASSPHRRYRINNREIERYAISELMNLLSYYKQIVASERRKRTGRERGRILFKL